MWILIYSHVDIEVGYMPEEKKNKEIHLLVADAGLEKTDKLAEYYHTLGKVQVQQGGTHPLRTQLFAPCDQEGNRAKTLWREVI